MATTTTIVITDDIDHAPNAQPYSFSYDGQAYSIDLSKENKTALEKALKPYLDAATKVPGATGTSRRKPAKAPSPKADLAEIRGWARANGHQVSDRGRIAASVMAAYDARH